MSTDQLANCAASIESVSLVVRGLFEDKVLLTHCLGMNFFLSKEDDTLEIEIFLEEFFDQYYGVRPMRLVNEAISISHVQSSLNREQREEMIQNLIDRVVVPFYQIVLRLDPRRKEMRTNQRIRNIAHSCASSGVRVFIKSILNRINAKRETSSQASPN